MTIARPSYRTSDGRVTYGAEGHVLGKDRDSVNIDGVWFDIRSVEFL